MNDVNLEEDILIKSDENKENINTSNIDDNEEDEDNEETNNSKFSRIRKIDLPAQKSPIKDLKDEIIASN